MSSDNLEEFLQAIHDFNGDSIPRMESFPTEVMGSKPYIVRQPLKIPFSDEQLDKLVDQGFFRVDPIYVSTDPQRRFSYFDNSIIRTEMDGKKIRYFDKRNDDICLNDVSLYLPPNNFWQDTPPMKMKQVYDTLVTEEGCHYHRYRVQRDHAKLLPPSLQSKEVSGAILPAKPSASLYIGGENFVTDLHFDGMARLITMVRGQKTIILFPPSDYDNLYSASHYQLRYARNYPFARRSMLCEPLDDIRTVLSYYHRYPKFRSTKPVPFILNAGETLYLPKGWWHYIKSTGPVNISINHDLADGGYVPPSPLYQQLSPYNEKKRYVSVNERSFRTDLIQSSYSGYRNFLSRIKQSKWQRSKWKDLCLMKDPFSLHIYNQLLEELKPRTILEFGAYEGGSSLWLRDMMAIRFQECQVYSFDIDAQRFRPKDESGLEFHKLDNMQIKEFVVRSDIQNILAQAERPILLIEDSHVNVYELLSTMDRFLRAGDYMVVEDTLDMKKYREMLRFLNDSGRYQVDTLMCDFYGYNCQYNFNGFLRKT